MDFTNIQTDEFGEYVVDQYGSKHRKAGKNCWTLSEKDMTQEHKDALAVQAEVQSKEERKQEIIQELNHIDDLRPRLLSDVSIGKGDEPKEIRGKNTTPRQELIDLETQAQALRDELSSL